jgi:hypothetical protein
MQTGYSSYHSKGFEGARADSRPGTFFPARNNSGGELAFGRFVVHDTGTGTSEIAAKLISGPNDVILGVVVRDLSHNPTLPSGGRATGVQDDDMFSVLTQGGIYVLTKQAVTPSHPVYVIMSGADAGRVRGDAGGTKQVTTVTPTAANSTRYALDVLVSGRTFTFEVTSDADATATEICDAFRTAMAANAAFTSQVVATGTATLILTGNPMTVTSNGAGTLAVALTTGPIPAAKFVAGARFAESEAADEIVHVELNLPT